MKMKVKRCISCNKDIYIPNANHAIYTIFKNKNKKIKCMNCIDRKLTYIEYVEYLELINRKVNI